MVHSQLPDDFNQNEDQEISIHDQVYYSLDSTEKFRDLNLSLSFKKGMNLYNIKLQRMIQQLSKNEINAEATINSNFIENNGVFNLRTQSVYNVLKYSESFNQATQINKIIVISISIVGIGILTLGIVLILINLLSVSKQKNSVLSLFSYISNLDISKIIEIVSTSNLQSNYQNEDEHRKSKKETLKNDLNVHTNEMTKEAITQEALLEISKMNEEENAHAENEEKERLRKKKEYFLSFNNNIIRKTMIKITFMILCILGFFVINIILNNIIYNNIDFISSALVYNSYREPLSNMLMLTLRYSAATNNTEIMTLSKKDDYTFHSFEKIMAELQKDENEMMNVRSSENGIVSNFIKTSALLGSSEFCNTIQELLEDKHKKECQTINGNALKDGLRNNVFRMIQIMRALALNLNASRSDDNLLKALKDENRQMMRYILAMYLRPAFKIQREALESDIDNYSSYINQFSIYRFVLFFIIATLSYIIFIKIFVISTLKKEILEARGLLCLIPNNILFSNQALKESYLINIA